MEEKQSEAAAQAALSPTHNDASPAAIMRCYNGVPDDVRDYCEARWTGMIEDYWQGMRDIHDKYAPHGEFRAWCRDHEVNYDTTVTILGRLARGLSAGGRVASERASISDIDARSLSDAPSSAAEADEQLIGVPIVDETGATSINIGAVSQRSAVTLGKLIKLAQSPGGEAVLAASAIDLERDMGEVNDDPSKRVEVLQRIYNRSTVDENEPRKMKESTQDGKLSTQIVLQCKLTDVVVECETDEEQDRVVEYLTAGGFKCKLPTLPLTR